MDTAYFGSVDSSCPDHHSDLSGTRFQRMAIGAFPLLDVCLSICRRQSAEAK
jgi:hypothetical protein